MPLSETKFLQEETVNNTGLAFFAPLLERALQEVLCAASTTKRNGRYIERIPGGIVNHTEGACSQAQRTTKEQFSAAHSLIIEKKGGRQHGRPIDAVSLAIQTD